MKICYCGNVYIYQILRFSNFISDFVHTVYTFAVQMPVGCTSYADV